MITARHVLISKCVVALSWVLGLAELARPMLHIPAVWLLTVMALSLLAHAGQCIYFTRKHRRVARPLAWHLAQIMVFGMPHVLGFEQGLRGQRGQAKP